MPSNNSVGKNKKNVGENKLVYKIILALAAFIAFGVSIYLIVAMIGQFQNAFTIHFGLPTVLVAVAIIALTLPVATKSRFGGDDKKDGIMMVIAVLLILAAALTVVLSYFGGFMK